MAKSSKIDIYKRRLQIRDLILKGNSDQDVMTQVGISRDTLAEDKQYISEQYLKAVTENKNLLARQAEYVMKHLDQLQIIKKKLWDMADDADNTVKTKIDSLKTILQELEHESRILRLIDNSNVIIKQYIHIDKISVLMGQLTEVIKEFVPAEKQKYAFDRIKGLGPILDVEGTVTPDTKE